MRFFWWKNFKFGNMESILEKKRFHPFKTRLYQNGKPENVPVVAGRLFQIFPEILSLLAENFLLFNVIGQ